MIQREIFKKIIPWLGKEKILILKGARQVGKTTLLKLIKTHLEKKQNAKVAYLLGDELDNRTILQTANSLELYLKQYFNFPNEYVYVLIDEFQACRGNMIMS